MVVNKVPSQLIIGERSELVAHAITLVKEALCPNQGLNNCFCQNCRWITNRQHPSLVWINPEGDYTLDDIDVIFDKIRFALGPDEQFFFILEQAQNLSAVTANKLLKTLEEPPAGYSIVLLCTNESGVLPTITSRCVVTKLSTTTASYSQNPLLAFFLMPTQQDPFAFETEIKRQKLSDTTSAEIFEQLAFVIADRYNQAVLAGDEEAIHKTAAQHQLLKRFLYILPQSGSSDLFWKQVWLQWRLQNGSI
jgi:hypothetical protein